MAVVNSAHSQARQSSSLMHECAHVMLKHKPEEAEHAADGLLLMSEDRSEQEAEADWLAGALLLPRVALLLIVHQAMTPDTAARAYGVSEDCYECGCSARGLIFKCGAVAARQITTTGCAIARRCSSLRKECNLTKQ
jgi:Zn-dependent peptidase ImmA (M78 family)